MDIVEKLEKKKCKLLKQYWSYDYSTTDLIIHSLESSTVRSFTYKKYYKKYKPISIYRTWLDNYLKEEMGNLKNEMDFNSLHSKAFQSLKKYWNEIDGGEPEDYKFYKLIDLFFKFLPNLNELDKERKEWLFEHANIPIDKYSLLSYKKHSDNSLNVRRNPSMKDVEVLKYEKIQTAIKKLVSYHPVLLFDLFAWEEGHSKPEPIEFKLIEHNKFN